MIHCHRLPVYRQGLSRLRTVTNRTSEVGVPNDR